jgi:hypothetical protein
MFDKNIKGINDGNKLLKQILNASKILLVIILKLNKIIKIIIIKKYVSIFFILKYTQINKKDNNVILCIIIN